MREGNFSLINGNGKRKWRAIVNFAEWNFPELDKAFPDAKFILTIRDLHPWMMSCKRHFRRNRKAWYQIRMDIFGSSVFNHNKFKDTHNRHQRFVIDYFNEKYPDTINEKLLVLDVCNNDNDNAWEELCAFLDKPVPKCSFPHKNAKRKRKGKNRKLKTRKK
jgi:hypothetical protein